MTPAAAEQKTVKWPVFRVQKLHQDRNEGLAVADYNGDGKPDISAGEFWYEGPAFTVQRPVRKLQPFSEGEYLTNNGEFAMDLNLDGVPDILSGSFMETELFWYENPGKQGLADAKLWTKHLLIDTGLGNNEAMWMADIDGDKRKDLLVNHWVDNQPMRYYKITPQKDGPKVEAVTVADAGNQTNGHGTGIGDVNGDGRMDIVYKNGWYEQLDGGKWTRHADWVKNQMSVPALVVDVTGDDRSDILWGNGHDYGLYWEEQLAPDKDGNLQWKQHLIDDSWSQAHVLEWHDLDGDGSKDLIAGKRHYGHGGRDPGANDVMVIYAYKWRQKDHKFERHPIFAGQTAKQGPGVGLQMCIEDLNGDGRPDIAVPGKSGTHILWNEAPDMKGE